MQTIPSDLQEKSSRCWTVASLHQDNPSDCDALEIVVNYTGDGNACKGIAIDHQIIPLFKLAPRLLHAVAERIRSYGDWCGLTKDETDEVLRLADSTPPDRRVAFEVPRDLYLSLVLGVHGTSVAAPESLELSHAQMCRLQQTAKSPTVALFARQRRALTAGGAIVIVTPTPE